MTTGIFDSSATIGEQIKPFTERLVKLCQKAGIGDEIDRAEQNWGSAYRRRDYLLTEQEDQRERRSEKKEVRRNVRRIVFAVSDIELRKAIIDAFLARHAVVLRWHRADNREEHLRFDAKAHEQPAWVASAMATSVVAVLLGDWIGYLLGTGSSLAGVTGEATRVIGAVAGAAVGVIGAIWMRDNQYRQRSIEGDQKRASLALSDRLFEEVLSEPPPFTWSEELSGEPDAREKS